MGISGYTHGVKLVSTPAIKDISTAINGEP